MIRCQKCGGELRYEKQFDEEENKLYRARCSGRFCSVMTDWYDRAYQAEKEWEKINTPKINEWDLLKNKIMSKVNGKNK